MRIDRLRLKNFRCFEDFEMEFSQGTNLHVIVAENMAGKSAIFQALRIGLGSFVGAINGTVQTIGKGDHRIIGQNPFSDVALECGVFLNGQGISAESTQVPLHWGREKEGINSNTRRFFADNVPRIDRFAKTLYEIVTERSQGVLPLIAYIGPEYVHVSASETSTFDDFQVLLGYHACLSGMSIEPFLLHWLERMNDRALESQNSGTASELFAGTPEVSLAVFKEVLRTLLPTITEVVWVTAGTLGNRNRKKMAFRFEDGSIRLFDQLSDGFQYLCLLAAELSMRAVLLNKHLGNNAAKEVPGVVLIDEFGIHLHPDLQTATLERLAAAFPKVQFILSTHSPMMVNGLRAEQVYILEVDEHGKRTMRHPDHDLVGAGAEGILRDIFGMASTYDEKTILAVKEHLDLHRKIVGGLATDADKTRFSALSEQLAGLNYDDSLRDPLYERFLKIYMERSNLRGAESASSEPTDAEMQAMVDRLLAEMNNSASLLQP